MSSEWSYPLPAHAAHIWLAGNTLFLGFPSPREGVRGRQVQLPINENTMLVLSHLLRSRERSHELDSINKPETPVQYNLDEIMKSFGGQVKVVGDKRMASVDLTLEDLDI